MNVNYENFADFVCPDIPTAGMTYKFFDINKD